MRVPPPSPLRETAHEHTLTVWSTHTDTDSNQLEMVLRKAVRFVKNDYSRKSSITAMRMDLDWDTLLQRRDQTHLYMMYRIVHQQVEILAERYLTPVDNRTRGHGRFKLLSLVTNIASSPERSYCGINSRKKQ